MKPLHLMDWGILHKFGCNNYTASNAGTGGAAARPTGWQVTTGTTASSRGMQYGYPQGLSQGVNFLNLDLDRFTRIGFILARANSDTQVVSRMQFKEAITEGALGAAGLGISCANLALRGESYGSSLGDIDLGVTLTTALTYQVEIRHYPGKRVEWWVNGDLKGQTSSVNQVPSGDLSSVAHVLSIVNGAAGGTNAWQWIGNLLFWQEN